MGNIVQEWRRKFNPNKPITIDPFWGMIANILQVEMVREPAVQAADIYAWSKTRSLSQTRSHRHLFKILCDTTTVWRADIDEQTLIKKHVVKDTS